MGYETFLLERILDEVIAIFAKFFTVVGGICPSYPPGPANDFTVALRLRKQVFSKIAAIQPLYLWIWVQKTI